MKSILLSFSFFLFSFTLIAQPSLDWDRIPDSLSHSYPNCQKVITDHNGDIYVLADKLYKYDQHGTLIWALTDSLAGYVDLLTDNVGGLYLCGQTPDSVTKGVVSKYSASGVLAWRRIDTFASSTLKSITLAVPYLYTTGKQIVPGIGNSILIEGYDTSGQLNWTKTDRVNNVESEATQITVFGFYLYVCGNYLYDASNFIYSGFVSTYDISGHNSWIDTTNFVYQLPIGITLDRIPDLYISVDQYITGSSSLLTKLDKNDNLLWVENKIVTIGTSPATIKQSVLDNKQNVIIFGSAGGGVCYPNQIDPISQAFLSRVRPNGDTVFSYYSPYCGGVYSCAIQDDNHIVALLSGRIDTTAELVSFDSTGHIHWTIAMPFKRSYGHITIDSGKNIILGMTSSYQGQSTSFVETRKYGTNIINSINEISTSTHIEVYPNPTKDFITIQSNGDNIDEAVLMDMSLQLVSSQQIKAAQYKINVEGFAKGVYFLELKTQTETSWYKIVID